MTRPDPSSPPHLAPGAAPLLDLSDDMRIRAIRTERWVGFARARRVLEILQALREHPPSTRPPGLAIFAHSNWRHDAYLRISLKVHSFLSWINC